MIYTSANHPKVNSQMTVYSLQGHTRPITSVKFNPDGDLLFTSSKDSTSPVSVWYAHNGERLGTYGHHRGAVWEVDPSWDSKYLLTGGGDGYCRMFEVTTGKFLLSMPHSGPVRSVAWSDGFNFITASDPFRTADSALISLYDFPSEDVIDLSASDVTDVPKYAPRHEIKIPNHANKATCLRWTYGNQHILAGSESGSLTMYDPRTGQLVLEKDLHSQRITQISFNKDKTLVATSSKDGIAKILDPRTLQVVKEFVTDRPLNGVVISPNLPHIIVGGGQDAQSVTTTSASQGKFEAKFYHLAYGDEFGRVKGHFGPINALAINPNGDCYASGSEDGYVRLHHFDKNYLNMPSYLPSEIQLN